MIRTLLILLLALTGVARANPYKQMVEATVIDGWSLPDGSQIAAIRLSLEPGWKTYWRAPGDAGVPPQMDWRRSKNLKSVEILWPTPEVFAQQGMRSIGYSGDVILPLRLWPQKNGQVINLITKLSIGICKDVCVPMDLKVKATLNPANTAPVSSIAAAIADQPFNGPEVGASPVTCSISPISDGLRIKAQLTMPPAGGTETAVIEAGDPRVWVSEPEITRTGRNVTLVADLVHTSDTAFALDRSALRFTILGRDFAADLKGCKSG